MKKNNKIYTLILLFFMCFLLSDKVFAKNKLFSCRYDVIINPEVKGTLSSAAITFPLDVAVYDDKTSEFKNNNLSLSKKYQNVYLSSDELSSYYVGLDNVNFYDYAVKGNLYSCPSLTLVRDTGNPAYHILYFYAASNIDGTNGDYMYVTSSVEPIVESGNTANIVKETCSCEPFVYKDDYLGGVDFKLKLKAYSDGSKKVCVSMDSLSDTCKEVKSDEDLTISASIKGNDYIYKIEKAQFSKFFIQDHFKKIEYNTFDCPENVYIAYVSGSPVTYILTTSKADAEELTNKISKLDPEHANSENKSNKCDVIPEIIKDYIKQALKLLRWGGLVLMIVLGTLDFVKAAASDDQDAMKKASQNFIKRLIAVVVLFLLPLLVEIVLQIAGLLKYGEECGFHITDF